MFKIRKFKQAATVSLLALTVLVSACDSDDDDSGDGVSTGGSTDTLSTTAVSLSSAESVPAVEDLGASGDGSFTVDTETGAITGSVTVEGTTGVPTMAHIHQGAAGETGPILIGLESNEDGTVWSTPADATLDAAGIAAFEAGETYVNVHTEANPGGELRAQLGEAAGPADTTSTAEVMLSSTESVPVVEDLGASGDGSFTVDTETGAISGSVTVEGTTGVPTMAHIHQGAAGETGPILIGLESNEDGTVWSTPADATLDAAGIAAFEAGETYVNVHTEANPGGELRAQLVADDGAGTSGGAAGGPGTITIAVRNTSATQPMTPPVIALHNAPGTDGGVRLFELGQPASPEVVAIAEDGNNDPLVALATAEADAGTVSAFGVAAPEAGGPLTPGATGSVTLDLVSDDQVMSLVSMVVCTNDGFSGVDSRPFSTADTETFTADIYDAGSEVNVLSLNYWVMPCGGEGNLHDDENGSVDFHQGQTGSENPDFDFANDAELLEITVTRN